MPYSKSEHIHPAHAGVIASRWLLEVGNQDFDLEVHGCGCGCAGCGCGGGCACDGCGGCGGSCSCEDGCGDGGEDESSVAGMDTNQDPATPPSTFEQIIEDIPGRSVEKSETPPGNKDFGWEFEVDPQTQFYVTVDYNEENERTGEEEEVEVTVGVKKKF